MEDDYSRGRLVDSQLVTPCVSSWLLYPPPLRAGETAPNIPLKLSYPIHRTILTRYEMLTKV